MTKAQLTDALATVFGSYGSHESLTAEEIAEKVCDHITHAPMPVAHFPMSRATKAMLQRRVTDLTRLYNEAAREANSLSDELVPFTARADVRKGETVIVRVPKRFRARNV